MQIFIIQKQSYIISNFLFWNNFRLELKNGTKNFCILSVSPNVSILPRLLYHPLPHIKKYIYIHIHVYLYIYICMYIWFIILSPPISLGRRIDIVIGIYTHTYIHIHTYACERHVCVCIYTHIYIRHHFSLSHLKVRFIEKWVTYGRFILSKYRLWWVLEIEYSLVTTTSIEIQNTSITAKVLRAPS